jgi:phospholipid transport system substrate-binding protein
MRRLTVLCLGSLFLAVSLAAVPARAAAPPEETVRSLYATLLDTMKRGPALGAKSRYDKLVPVIRASFDIPHMARLAVGPSWARLAPDQQQAVSEAFARYLSATYADRFDGYSGEKLEVIGERASRYGPMVETRIVKSNGEPVSINYLMRKNEDEWQIADVYLTGTVSEVAALRSQFGAVLAREGVDGLISTMNRKVETLVGERS